MGHVLLFDLGVLAGGPGEADPVVWVCGGWGMQGGLAKLTSIISSVGASIWDIR